MRKTGATVSSSGRLAYIDTSALMKLVVAEPESGPLRSTLSSWPHVASSELTVVELIRNARRISPSNETRALEVLSGVALHPADREVMRRAAWLAPAQLRSLDAIHLATALELGDDLAVLFAYDRRLLEAAGLVGIPTYSPGLHRSS